MTNILYLNNLIIILFSNYLKFISNFKNNFNKIEIFKIEVFSSNLYFWPFNLYLTNILFVKFFK